MDRELREMENALRRENERAEEEGGHPMVQAADRFMAEFNRIGLGRAAAAAAPVDGRPPIVPPPPGIPHPVERVEEFIHPGDAAPGAANAAGAPAAAAQAAAASTNPTSVRFPDFTGVGSATHYDPAEWLMQVQGIIEQFSMTDPHIMGAVQRCMRGHALYWFRRLKFTEADGMDKWETFQPIFRERFRVSVNLTQKARLIQSLRQKESESARDFLDRVGVVVHEVYASCKPAAPPAEGPGSATLRWQRAQFHRDLTEIQKISYVSGLRDLGRKECERRAASTSTLDQLAEMAENVENSDKRNAPPFIAPVDTDGPSGQADALEDLANSDVAALRGGYSARGARGRGRGAPAGRGRGGKQGNATKPKSFRNDGNPDYLDLPNGRVYKCYKCGGYGTHRSGNCPVMPGKVATIDGGGEEEKQEEAGAADQAAASGNDGILSLENEDWDQDFGDLASLNF